MNNRNSYIVDVLFDLLCWIENNLSEKMLIGDVSLRSGYSRWYLQRIFRQYTGLCLATHIRQRRLLYSALMLKITRKKIIEIAIELGFTSQQSFSRAFSQSFHASPAVFRHRSRLPSARFCASLHCLFSLAEMRGATRGHTRKNAFFPLFLPNNGTAENTSPTLTVYVTDDLLRRKEIPPLSAIDKFLAPAAKYLDERQGIAHFTLKPRIPLCKEWVRFSIALSFMAHQLPVS